MKFYVTYILKTAICLDSTIKDTGTHKIAASKHEDVLNTLENTESGNVIN